MHNEHLEKRIAAAKLFDDEKRKNPVAEFMDKKLSLTKEHISKHQAQEIIKSFFCECIERDIMEIDVVDANAELCRRIENAEPYAESRGENGKKIEDINCLRRKPGGVQGF